MDFRDLTADDDTNLLKSTNLLGNSIPLPPTIPFACNIFGRSTPKAPLIGDNNNFNIDNNQTASPTSNTPAKTKKTVNKDHQQMH